MEYEAKVAETVWGGRLFHAIIPEARCFQCETTIRAQMIPHHNIQPRHTQTQLSQLQ